MVGVDGGVVMVSGVDLILVGEVPKWEVPPSVEEIVGFGGGESRTADGTRGV